MVAWRGTRRLEGGRGERNGRGVMVEALSLEVIQCRTSTLKRTGGS